MDCKTSHLLALLESVNATTLPCEIRCLCVVCECDSQTSATARLAVVRAAAQTALVPATPASQEVTAKCRICVSARCVGLEPAATEPAAALKAFLGTAARLKVSHRGESKLVMNSHIIIQRICGIQS
jgi:hypothetical protein